MPVEVSSVEPWQNPVEDKKALAKQIVGYSIVVRKSDQSLNPESLFWVLCIVIMFGWFFNRVANRIQVANERNAVIATRLIQGGNAYDIGGLANLRVPNTATPAPTFTALPTIMPTITPTITATALYSVDVVFKYSYYNPKLGGANCANFDYVLNDCISLMANGEDWHGNYGKVVACAPDIALGTVVVVTFPDALKGTWICKDRGGAIVGDFIDFLDLKQRYSWTSPVSAKLYPPSTPLEQITSGSH